MTTKPYNTINGRELVFGDREQINYLKKWRPVHEGKKPIPVDMLDNVNDDTTIFPCLNVRCTCSVVMDEELGFASCECGYDYEVKDDGIYAVVE